MNNPSSAFYVAKHRYKCSAWLCFNTHVRSAHSGTACCRRRRGRPCPSWPTAKRWPGPLKKSNLKSFVEKQVEPRKMKWTLRLDWWEWECREPQTVLDSPSAGCCAPGRRAKRKCCRTPARASEGVAWSCRNACKRWERKNARLYF